MATEGKEKKVDASLDKWLRQQQQNFKTQQEKAAEGGGGFERTPKGIYIMRLSSAEIGDSSNDRKQVVWEFVIVDDGDRRGKTHKVYDQLETERGFEFLLYRLKDMGVDGTENMKLPELPGVLESLVEKSARAYKIKVTPKGDFDNTKITKIYEDYDGEEDNDE